MSVYLSKGKLQIYQQKHKGFLSLRIKTSEKFQKQFSEKGISNNVCLTFKRRWENIEFDVIKKL